MDFQHDKSWDNLLLVLSSKLTIVDSWNRIIDFHEEVSPKAYWQTLRGLDIQSEQIEIKNWIEQILSVSPLSDNIIALWIGILKMEGEDDEEIPTIYMVGSETYEHEDINWVSNPNYVPDNRYACPEVLKQLDELIKRDKDNYEFLEWILPLAYCALTIDELVRTEFNKNLFLVSQNKLHFSIGYDNGDYLEISSIEEY